MSLSTFADSVDLEVKNAVRNMNLGRLATLKVHGVDLCRGTKTYARLLRDQDYARIKMLTFDLQSPPILNSTDDPSDFRERIVVREFESASLEFIKWFATDICPQMNTESQLMFAAYCQSGYSELYQKLKDPRELRLSFQAASEDSIWMFKHMPNFRRYRRHELLNPETLDVLCTSTISLSIPELNHQQQFIAAAYASWLTQLAVNEHQHELQYDVESYRAVVNHMLTDLINLAPDSVLPPVCQAEPSLVSQAVQYCLKDLEFYHRHEQFRPIWDLIFQSLNDSEALQALKTITEQSMNHFATLSSPIFKSSTDILAVSRTLSASKPKLSRVI